MRTTPVHLRRKDVGHRLITLHGATAVALACSSASSLSCVCVGGQDSAPADVRLGLVARRRCDDAAHRRRRERRRAHARCCGTSEYKRERDMVRVAIDALERQRRQQETYTRDAVVVVRRSCPAERVAVFAFGDGVCGDRWNDTCLGCAPLLGALLAAVASTRRFFRMLQASTPHE